MSAHSLARELFASPGAAPAHTRHLLAQAAGSHARLLHSAAASHEERLDRLGDSVAGYLRSAAPPAEKRFVLDDPQFVEALHALVSTSGEVARWDATVAPGCYHVPAEREARLGVGRLGNVVAAIALRRRRDWCGQFDLATDGYGRVHVPFSDWALVLVDENNDGRELFAHQTIALALDERQARWSLPGRTTSQPLARLRRQAFDAMFVDNCDHVRSSDVDLLAGPPRPWFERAARLGRTPIRYEPVADNAPAAHADLTGGIVAALLAAIERNAPRIHDQLCQCIRTIHGFELPPVESGRIDSFSAPTSPGVIGFNVQYTPRDEPRLSPYCFMWLGHELGHTLHYLIDDVAYTHGWQFLENPGEMTPLLPRYGRSVTVRTLFQIPYVHLYEWWLLMLFHERRFAGLPWRMPDDAIAVGEEVRDEIAEAFDLIDAHARLTTMGQAILARLRQLATEAESHWRSLSAAAVRDRSRA